MTSCDAWCDCVRLAVCATVLLCVRVCDRLCVRLCVDDRLCRCAAVPVTGCHCVTDCGWWGVASTDCEWR